MIPLPCLQHAAARYQIPASSLERVLRTTASLRRRHLEGTGIGVTGIQPGWVPLLKQQGFTFRALRTNTCTNIAAAAWILANNQRVKAAYRHTVGVPLPLQLDAERASRVTGVPANVLLAVAWQESDFKPNAVSPKGAQGLMQFIPSTWTTYGRGSPFDPQAALVAGGYYLHHLYNDFHNWDLAFAGYNAGGQAVRNYGYRIPPYPQTQAYVPSVLEHYQELRGRLEPVRLDSAAPTPRIIVSTPPGG